MPHDLQRIHDLLDDLDDLSPSEMIDFNRKVEELRKAKMSDEKPKAPTGADILSAVNQGLGDVTRQLLALASEIAAVRGTQADHGAKLDALRVSNTGMGARSSSGNAPGAASFAGTVTHFGPFGKQSGQPIAGANPDDLRYYRSVAVRALDNPKAQRHRAENEATIAAIDAEIARQTGGQSAFETQRTGGGAPPLDERPPPDDDSMPF